MQTIKHKKIGHVALITLQTETTVHATVIANPTNKKFVVIGEKLEFPVTSIGVVWEKTDFYKK